MERFGQQIAEPARPGEMVDEQLRATVLEQQLATPAARHQRCSAAVDTCQRDQPTPTRGMQGAHHTAFRAQGKPV